MGSGEDQIRKGEDGATRDIEPCAEVIPEADAELGAGLCEPEEGIARVAAEIATGAAGDFAPCDVTRDIAANRPLPPTASPPAASARQAKDRQCSRAAACPQRI